MTPTLKKLLNSLKCPICNSQIDIVKQSYYTCVATQDHFSIYIKNERIVLETVRIYDDCHKYCISKQLDVDNNTIKTIIYIYDADIECRVYFNFKEIEISFDYDVFDFRNFDRFKALKRIKTLMTFQ